MKEMQMEKNELLNAVITVTGGTGSFGNTFVNYIIANHPEIQEIRVFSRDENKQDSMRKKYDFDKIKFYLGDVRERSSVDRVMKGTNLVFHAAALKQVPSCEFFPREAVATNVNGSFNVFESAIACGVSNVVALSTDKAVYPINTMGTTKAIMEKSAQSYARTSEGVVQTHFNITRYGNVMLSRGSVIPLFVEQFKRHKSITLTNPNMTRFLMSLDESVNLVMHAFLQGENGDLYVKKAPACTVEVLAEAIASTLNLKSWDKQVIGTRHGEKLHESLLTTEEMSKAEEENEYFRVPLDIRSLNYRPFFEEGRLLNKKDEETSYTSETTNQLSKQEVIEILLKLEGYQQLLG